jgi:transcriptional regulator with XRE-family HTH domain
MIKELREMGLTQAMIAREMGTVRQVVNDWFTGDQTPTARSISRLSTAITKLTGKTFTPADAYMLVDKVSTRYKKERENA